MSARETTRFVVTSVLQGLAAVLVMAALGPLTLAVVERVTGR